MAVQNNDYTSMITDMAFNFYGVRLAVTTFGGTVRVSKVHNEETIQEAEFTAHDGPVLTVAWAYPEFGSIFATGGVDGTVKIWNEETFINEKGESQPQWNQVAALTEGTGTIRGVDFAPSEFGLRVAAISSDNHCRVWDCRAPASLTNWELKSDIDVRSIGTSSASPASSENPTTGGESTTTSGKSESDSSKQQSFSGTHDSQRMRGFIESDGGWAVSWFQGPWYGPCLAVAAGVSPIVKLIHIPDYSTPNVFLTLIPPNTPEKSSAPISSVRWAPPTGRSYISVATGARNGSANVYLIYPPELDPNTHAPTQWRVVHDVELKSADTELSGTVSTAKVDWNMSGSVLSVANAAGHVQLWSTTFAGQWKPLVSLNVDE